MCGIAAIRTPRRDGFGHALSAALTAMHHRGPDDTGVYVSSRADVGLGSARLAIMDPANGHQPVANEDRGIHAVVNGEFYESDRLRKALEDRGHRVRTGSDSELLVHLYEEHGTGCLRFLRGEFAFVLLDESANRLFLACDRFAIKPLHYARSRGGWIIASEIKALIAMGMEPRWDLAALQQSLAFQYGKPGSTLFEGVRQLRPAHAMVLDGDDCKEFVYWEPCFEPDPTITAEAIGAALREAVHLRLRADVPMACTLSGGLDSSAVAAISGIRDCFCVRFDAPEYDEGPQVLEDGPSDVRIHQVPVTRRDQVMHLEDAVRHSEGLAINGQLVGKFLLSRAIRDAGFKVVLAGEGADEAFLGYAHLQQDYTDTPPQIALQQGIMLPAPGESFPWRMPTWLERVPTFLQAKLATGRHAAALLAHPPNPQTILDDCLGGIDLPSGPFVRRSAWLWTRMALAGYILRTLGDGAEMAHSVEARLPFLDHELFAVAARIPPPALLDHEHTKLALREALRGIVPETVRTRKKHPFLAPPLDGDQAVDDFVQDTLASTACRELPLFDHRAVRRWAAARFRLPDADRHRLDPVLMQLLTATLLQRCFRMT